MRIDWPLKFLLLQAIVAMGTTTDPTALPSIPGMDELVEFVAGYGGDSSNLDFAIGPEGGGTFASRDIKQGELLLRIPRAAIFSAHLKSKTSILMKSEPCQRILDHSDKLYPAALLLYIETAKKYSEFRSYFDFLGQEVPMNVFSFTDEDLEYCPDDEIVKLQTLHNRKVLDDSYQEVTKCVNSVQDKLVSLGVDFEKLTKEHLQWCYAILMSRSWGFSVNGVDHRGLFPLLDMPNHQVNDKAPLSQWNVLETHVDIRAGRDYTKGEQVYECYGLFGNLNLFQSFGFAFDQCTMYDDAKFEAKVGDTSFNFKLSWNGMVPENLLEIWKKTVNDLSTQGKPTIRFREFNVFLLKAVEARLEQVQSQGAASIQMVEQKQQGKATTERGLYIKKHCNTIRQCNLQILDQSQRNLKEMIPKIEKMYQRCDCDEPQERLPFDDCNSICASF